MKHPHQKIMGVLLLTLFFVSTLPSLGAEGAFSVEHVSARVDKNTLRLVLRTAQPDPTVSAYFLSAPDRLVIDIADSKGSLKLGRKPATKMVRSWAVKRSGLNRTSLVLGLRYRPPNSHIGLDVVGNSVVVEVSTQPGHKDKWKLTEGVTWVREDRFLAGRWTRTNQLLFDPRDKNVEVLVGLANEKTNAREKLSDMVRRYDALAGINGGFFAGGGGALGLVYRDGRMIVPHVSRRPPRSGFGMTEDGRPLFGRLAAAGPTIKDLDGADWSQVKLALGGGPRLIKDGATKITADLEELGPKGNNITRVAARTVVGMTKSGTLLFGTVTGFHDNHKEGVKFGPLVQWLKTLGVQEAVNFDGGSSVDMVVGPHIVSDGPANASKEKAVATALLIKDKREKLFPETATWDFSTQTLPADGKSTATLRVQLKQGNGQPVPDGTHVHLFGHGVNVDPAESKTKDGQVEVRIKSVLRPGQARITLNAGPLTEKRTFVLKAGGVKDLLIEGFGARPLDNEKSMQTATVKVQTVDQWGNGVPKQAIKCSVDGTEAVAFTTDHRGIMALDVEVSRQGGTFTVSHPTGGQQTYHIPAFESLKE